MEYRKLGKTGIEVSRLCFGGLTVGPLQSNMTFEDGGKVIESALNSGVNFIDTAQMYETYGHIRHGIKNFNRNDLVICSKSYAYSTETAEESLMEALKELNTDYIDVFLLHEQESEHTIRGHYEALEYYMRMKEKGIIRAVGLSTHRVSGVLGALKYDEIEIIHPIINKAGLGIQDGSIEEMLQAVDAFHKKGGGVFGMKPIGGGNLISSVDECFDYVLGLPMLDSIAVGMQSVAEVEANVAIFEGREVSDQVKLKLNQTNRRLKIASWCTGCGACVEKCTHGALSIDKGKAEVVKEKCVICGYCSSVCPDFCIKVI